MKKIIRIGWEEKKLINNQGVMRSFKEGDVWWAALGENVGVEIDGKSAKYSRPIVILKKHSNLFFYGHTVDNATSCRYTV